jgi:hypothetical protein
MTSEIVQMPAITLNRAMKPNRVIKTGALKVTMIFWTQRDLGMSAHNRISW